MSRRELGFILVGIDERAERFVRAAIARGYRLVGVFGVEDHQRHSFLAGVTVLERLDDVAKHFRLAGVIVSGPFAARAERLKSLLRFEPTDVVVATPIARSADVYYETTLVQTENHIRMLPLLEDGDHPALTRIVELLQNEGLGRTRWVELTLPLPARRENEPRFLLGWSWLRTMLGEIESVSATATGEDVNHPSQVMVSAKWSSGILATIRFLAGLDIRTKLTLTTEFGSIECELPDGLSGSAEVRWRCGDRQDAERFDVQEIGERWLDRWESLDDGDDGAGWKMATRQVELAEAVERSLDRERTVSLEYDEFSDAAGFKSIMTAVGCGLVWLIILAAIASAAGAPFVGHLILPILLVFLGLQFFGLVYRGESS